MDSTTNNNMAQGLTLQQLQGMGAKPVQPQGQGLTLQQLQAKGATPGSDTMPKSDPTHQSFLQRVKTTIQNSANQVNDAIGGNGNFAGKSVLNRATGAVARAFNAIPGVAMDALPQKASDAINKGTTNLVDWVANNAGRNPLDVLGGKKIAPIVDNTHYQDFANSNVGQTTADVAGTVSNTGQIAGDILTADQIAKAPSQVANTFGKVATKMGVKIGDARAGGITPSEPQPLDEAKIIDRYNRAIKPTVAGKVNANQIAKGNSNVVSAIKAIGDNKDNLNFTDANGEAIQGQLPKSVDQFTQAITQTKKGIFQQYDALAKQAGEQGVAISTKQIASELQPVIDSKSLQIANPRAVDYAQQFQQRLNAEGSLSATDAQDVVQHLNEGLKAFYRNPNYETASTASVDALIANKMREALDTQITDVTGTQYQALKDQYGALSNIEKDVTHRNIVWGRQNTVGLANNLSSVASGAELVRGLIKLNPADLATAGVIKGIQKYIQYLNNPDVGVSKIFSAVEKSNPSSIEGSLPPAGSQPGGMSSSDFTTKPIKSQSVPQVPNEPAPKTIPKDDLNTMSDFTDYVAKSYKPTATEAQQLELDASRIAERYGIKIGKTNKSISNAFGKVLEQQKFAKTK